MMAFTRGNTRLLGALRLPVGICVCGHTPLTNLAALGERFGHDAEEEVWTALAEIAAIVRVQMEGLVDQRGVDVPGLRRYGQP